MEEIWSSDCNLDEIALKRLEDGGWMLQASQQGSFGEPTVFLDRKQLKDLHDAIEHELYPERFLPQAPKNLVWEEKPKNCPTCNRELRQSRFSDDKLFCTPDPANPHGLTYSFVLYGKRMYGWYSLLGVNLNRVKRGE